VNLHAKKYLDINLHAKTMSRYIFFINLKYLIRSISIPLYSTQVFEFRFTTQFQNLPANNTFREIQAVDLTVCSSMCRLSDRMSFDPMAVSVRIRHPDSRARGFMLLKSLEASWRVRQKVIW
jgi:hypothetical protein